jgi:carboxylesterase
VRWQEWFASVVTTYEQLAHQCTDVVVVGYSLGGLLAVHLAARHRILGVVTLAAALTPAGGWPLQLLGIGRFVLPWLYPFRNADFSDPNIRGQLVEKMGQVDFDDPTVIAGLRSDIRISTRSIYEVIRLGRVVRRELPRVQQPALIMQGRRDTTVLPISAEHVYRLLGSTDKQIAWFERSGHLLPNDVERKQVWERIAQWLEQHTKQIQAAATHPATKKQERSHERS